MYRQPDVFQVKRIKLFFFPPGQKPEVCVVGNPSYDSIWSCYSVLSRKQYYHTPCRYPPNQPFHDVPTARSTVCYSFELLPEQDTSPTGNRFLFFCAESVCHSCSTLSDNCLYAVRRSFISCSLQGKSLIILNLGSFFFRTSIPHKFRFTDISQTISFLHDRL